MRLGTKSLLFGLHQCFLHPAVMLIAYLKVFRRIPSLMEIIAIVVHDWGYWGCEGIDSMGGEGHPYLGAHIMRKLYGQKGWELCIGHNDETAQKEGVKRSVIYTVDKYYYVVIPVWLHKLLGTLSGEYREIQLAKDRQWDPRGYKKTMALRFFSGDLF